jgi:hypothetical protein
MYYFKKIDVSDIEPFDRDQSINFSDGLTLITDKDGSGNRTIHNTLRKEFISADHVDPIAGNIERYTWLVFLDERLGNDLPSIRCPWKPLTSILSSNNVTPTMHHEFETNVTKCIRQILSTKAQGLSKFNRWIKSSDELYASVSSEGAISVSAGQNGVNIDHCFQAAGESFILYISIIYAVRKLLSLELPFVSVCDFRFNDQFLRGSFSQFISNMSIQTIIFERERIVKSLGSEAAYQVISHPDSGKSVIERCSNSFAEDNKSFH